MMNKIYILIYRVKLRSRCNCLELRVFIYLQEKMRNKAYILFTRDSQGKRNMQATQI